MHDTVSTFEMPKLSVNRKDEKIQSSFTALTSDMEYGKIS